MMDHTTALAKLEAVNSKSAMDSVGDTLRKNLKRLDTSISEYETGLLLLGNLLASMKNELAAMKKHRDVQGKNLKEHHQKAGAFLQDLRGNGNG